jgi:hypothetical protein
VSDLAALTALHVTSVTRATLERAWISVAGSHDLIEHGYRVQVWALILRGASGTTTHTLLEYLDPLELVRGRSVLGRSHAHVGVHRPLGPVRLPRVTAHTYRRQVAVHRALGLSVVLPGRPWIDHGQGGLFDRALEAAS